MNSRQHYAEAERLIGPDAIPQQYTGEDYDSFRADNLAMAQVHATLALRDVIREIGDQLDSKPRHTLDLGSIFAHLDISDEQFNEAYRRAHAEMQRARKDGES